MAGQQSLAPTTAGQYRHGFQSKRFACCNVDRPVADHDGLLSWHLQPLQGALEVFRVWFDKAHGLAWEKYVT